MIFIYSAMRVCLVPGHFYWVFFNILWDASKFCQLPLQLELRICSLFQGFCHRWIPHIMHKHEQSHGCSLFYTTHIFIYRKISNIRHTKSPNLNDSHLVLKSSLPNPLKPGVKSRRKMKLEQRRQAMLQLHLTDRQFSCLLRCNLY